MRERILLVDDEEGIRTVLGLTLIDAGYDVLTADGGLSALEIFRVERQPIVITDIKMPGMDGVELLRAIKEESPDAEVIMTTGHGDMELAVESLRLGAADFIAKPISGDALDVAIKRAQEKIELRRRLREYTENLEKLVEEKTRELLAAERMAAVGQTVAEMSHAVKNMAGGLEGAMFVLEKGLELDNREYLLQGWDLLKRDVARLKGLALDLLGYAGPADVAPRPADPNETAREAVRLMAEQARLVGVELVLELAPDAGPALIDPEAVHRCLLNLVANAIESFQDAGRPYGTDERRVVVRTTRRGRWMECRVEDNGSGMSEDIRGRLFKGFFSAKGGRGTGVGLMATKKLVDQLKGEIEAESTPGAGSVFTLRFPAA